MASILSDNIHVFTQGLVSTASDLMLLSILFNFNFDLNDVNKVDEEERLAIEAFYKIPMKTIRRSIRHLRAQKYVTENKEVDSPYILTEEGNSYLYSIIPQYKTDRPWDGRLYLVTYDVPRTNNKQRNALRDFLKSLGAGLLQHSVWVLTFNPKSQIEEFKVNNNIETAIIIISSFGPEGGVVGKDLKDIATDTFNVQKANALYNTFLSKHTLAVARERLVFHYLNALKRDPQLPFELYSPDWKGIEALSIYQKLI